MKKLETLDIVVPVLNEAESLPGLLSRIDSSLKSANIKYRVIVVDDHSTDKTESVVNKLSKSYPVIFKSKVGKQGKAYSILEGASYSKSKYLVMIDGDLQYAPENIPLMYKKAEEKELGVVVANRVSHKEGFIRKIGSKVIKFLAGKILMGLNLDVQSGLKLFKRTILAHIEQKDVKPWSFDIPLLHTAAELGYSIGSIDIDFENRLFGKSKFNLVSSIEGIFEVFSGAFKLKLRPRKVFHFKPTQKGSMMGAGLNYKKKRFLTHTTLSHSNSALITFSTGQKIFIFSLIAIFLLGLVLATKSTLITFVAILSIFYFADVFFNLFLVLKSLHFPPEIFFDEEELQKIDDSKLPLYTILCPLYHEASVLPQFVDSIEKLDYPKNKLEVLILLEEDDEKTIAKAKELKLASYFKVLIVPDSQPKTKPKACNYGLAHAKGEYVVIYDAEDIPDPMQLKKAFLGFNRLGTGYSCLQAKLNYHNPNQNLLTRFFTSEYSLWFDIMLPALQTINTTIPLGGTSNHFRRSDLNKFEGWDPFNVTEDADLGIRLFKAGGKTAIIDSVTLEEANSNLKNWIRQRSRWIKGYLQTYFVHMRNPLQFAREHKIHYVVFQLVSGLRISFMLINPILWGLTLSYFLLYKFVGPQIESLYPAPVFYMAITSAVFGNFLYIYYYMIGTAKHGQHQLIKYVLLIPIYWIFASIAAFVAFWQLLVKPHYWEKTIHGLTKDESKKFKGFKFDNVNNFISSNYKKISTPAFKSGIVLIVATVINYLFNFLYNTFLGRELKPVDFGTISFFGSILYVLSLVTSGLSRTVTYRSAYLAGKFGSPQKSFWKKIISKSIVWSIVITTLWIVAIPLLQLFFKIEYPYTLLLFAPVIVIGITNSINEGFLNGNHRFSVIAIMISVEALSKFLFSYIFVKSGHTELVVASLPMSLLLSLSVSSLFIKKINTEYVEKDLPKNNEVFPFGFFVTSILARLSSVAFLSFDLLLAKRYLSPEDAGKYALVSLVGKMIFFAGSIFNQFITPLVSKSEGANEDSSKVFYRMLSITFLSCVLSYLVFGVFGYITAPILLGDKILPVIHLLPIFGIGMIMFTLSESFIPYHVVKGHKIFPFIGILLSVVQVFAFSHFHQGLDSIVYIMSSLGLLYLLTVVLLHFNMDFINSLIFNVNDFLGLFKKSKNVNVKSGKLKILIFNWRDIRHVWSGGAEVYVHEIARRLVDKGHLVTVFCGNDTKSPRNEVIDGVQMVRRGGFYTVYFWAFVYYALRFKGRYDLIIDNENGIPFFTPLYSKEPVIGLIHHVHQEVILKELNLPKYLFPVGILATLLERYVMPVVYKNSQMVTVSESSKKDMEKIGFGKNIPIRIVNPGVTLSKFKHLKKNINPTILYLGRLKAYKSVDTLIKAVSYLRKDIHNIRLIIAGYGEMLPHLKKVVSDMKLENTVTFVGKVSEEEKLKIMSKAWVFAYPSTFEGWGISVIEANASGTPVVASNVAGLRDSVIENYSGYLVKVKDVNKFAQTLKLVLSDDKLRSRLIKTSIKWADNFDWDRSTDKFLSCIYDSINRDNSDDYIGTGVEISLD